MLMNAPKHGVETWAKNLYRRKLSLLQYAGVGRGDLGFWGLFGMEGGCD